MSEKHCKESDWKLFKKLVPLWQENYMAKLNAEYIEILKQDKNASSNFWELEGRIKKDKKHHGVILEMSRSEMLFNILGLLREGVITLADLNDFSDELKEEIKYFGY